MIELATIVNLECVYLIFAGININLLKATGHVMHSTAWPRYYYRICLQRPKKTAKSLSDNARRSEIRARHATNVECYHYTNLLRTLLYQEPRP